MPDMTDEEANALEKQVTENPPKVSGSGKSGFFMKHKGNVVILDDISATWLRAKSELSHTTPEAIIGVLVREKIASMAN